MDFTYTMTLTPEEKNLLEMALIHDRDRYEDNALEGDANHVGFWNHRAEVVASLLATSEALLAETIVIEVSA